MTDYLELAAGGEAEALWQASRELDGSISAQRGGALPTEEMVAAGQTVLPLLEELDRADRQAEEITVLAAGRSRAADADHYEERLRRAGAGVAGADRARLRDVPALRREESQWEDRLWLKRVDQAFQRDSRRYDGPFSLY